MKVNGRIQLYPILRVVIFFIIGIVLGTESFGLIPFAWWFAALLLSLGAAYVFDRHAITQTVLIFTACTCLGGCLTVRELDSVDISLPEDEVCFEAVVVSPTVITGKVVRLRHDYNRQAQTYQDKGKHFPRQQVGGAQARLWT